MLGTVLKRAGGLGLGTAIGQGVVLAATPWLVRVYGPTSFGVLALLITATNVSIAVGVSTRGALAWYRAAQAHAFADGRDYAVPDDFK